MKQPELLQKRAYSIESMAEEKFVDSNGVIYTTIDKATDLPPDDAFFEASVSPKVPEVKLSDFWKYENCGMTTGAYLCAMVLRYESERDDEALKRAARSYQGLKHVYEIGKELEEGFFPKIYGGRFHRQTSTDQVLYAVMAMDSYSKYAGAEERADISRMIEMMVRFWVKRDYRFGYYYIPEMQWPLARFPSLLLLAYNHSRDSLFESEYRRLLGEGVNRHPGEERLRPKAEGEKGATEKEKEQQAWLLRQLPDAVSMDIMELEYLLKNDPGNPWAKSWRKSVEQMWEEACLTLSPDGKSYIEVWVGMNDGKPRQAGPFDKDGQTGAKSGWSSMIARAGLQGAEYMSSAEEVIETSRGILEKLDVQDLTYADEPDRFPPENRYKTRVLSGDAMSNWLWAYWIGRSRGYW